LLGERDATQLKLVLQPHVQVLRSDWPLCALHTAHRLPAETQVQAMSEALSSPKTGHDTGHVVVWRHPWTAQCKRLDEAHGAWMMRWLDATHRDGSPVNDAHGVDSLSACLSEALPGFDFTVWLQEALTEGWLWRVEDLVGPQG
jgi:hypothetical protein